MFNLFFLLSILNLNVFAFNVNSCSDITVDELKPYMHPDCEHLAGAVIRICNKYDVSPEFIVSIMRYEKRPDLHNWFGWTKEDNTLMKFDNDVECLEFVIERIKVDYLTESGKYFNGYTIDDISIYYNNSDYWRETMNTETNYIVQNT